MWRDILVNFIIRLPESQGCKNIAVITDRLSKGVILEPMGEITAVAFAKVFLRTFYRHYGLPHSIVSDRGQQFIRSLWRRVCQLLEIV